VKKRTIGLLTLVAALTLAGCSGLTGATNTNPANPTGSAAPLPSVLPTTQLAVAVPPYATVAANCAARDANSCAEQTTIQTFCHANNTVQAVLKPCTDEGWMQQ
jgi:hypothetical protein